MTNQVQFILARAPILLFALALSASCAHQPLNTSPPGAPVEATPSLPPISTTPDGGPSTAQGIAGERFSERAFEVWRRASSERAAAFDDFRAFLDQNGVGDVVPAFEIWRTSSSSAQCGADAFVIPERVYWPNIVQTLRYVRDFVRPSIGPVEVVSAYRDATLNTCSGGAPRSAHREFYALDLAPLTATVRRTDLIERMCRLHRTYGQAFALGLGFYSGTRFHIDTKRYRRWGPDTTSASSPCVAYD